MRLIRSRLAAIALTVVVWQITGVAVTPVVLCGVTSVRSAVTDDQACTCDHAGDGICPMHKTAKKANATPTSRESRWCPGCGEQADMMVLTMLSTSAGPIQRRHRTIRPVEASAPVFLTSTALADVVRLPVSPPPKS